MKLIKIIALFMAVITVLLILNEMDLCFKKQLQNMQEEQKKIQGYLDQ